MSLVPTAPTDAQFIAIWLHGRPDTTQRAYRREVRLLLDWLGKPLADTTLADVQAYVDTLERFAPATRRRIIATIKSLFSMAHDTGYLRFNVARVLRSPSNRDRLAERMLTPGQVERLLAATTNARDYAILMVLYASGCRISELTSLHWRDCQERGEAGQITVYGKGGKERAVLLPLPAWEALQAIGPGAPDEPVFRAVHTNHQLAAVTVRYHLQRWAKAAGVNLPVTPHWYRHTHATHALEGGAPLPLVQATLGHSNISTTGRYLHVRPGDSSGRYLKIERKPK